MIEWDLWDWWREGLFDSQEAFANIKGADSEGPKDGYIDAGISLVGVIEITQEEVEDISWLDAAYLDELVGKWNLEYYYNPLTGSYRISSAVPCITTLEA
jgi:hypothetical protein